MITILNNIKNQWVVCVFFIICICSGCILPSKKFQLQLRLQTGQSYALKVTTAQQTVQTIQKRKQEMNQTTAIGYVFDVLEVDNQGTAVIKVVYHSVFFKQNAQRQNVEYDSSAIGVSVPEGAEGFAALVGQKFLMRVSSKGEVLDIYGTEEIMAKLAKAFDLSDSYIRAYMLQNLKNQFSKAVLQETIQKLFGIYPEQLVGVGDKWKKLFNIKKDFLLNFDTQQKFKGYKNGVVFIEESSKIKSNPQAAPMQMGFMQMKYNLSGIQQGVLEVDEYTGWLRQAKFSQELEGDVVLNDKSWPISITSVITVEPFERYPVIQRY